MIAGYRARVLAGIAVALLQVPVLAQTSPDEDLARRRFGEAKHNLQQGNYSRALSDLAYICKNYQTTTVAGDALLQIALYHLETSHDLRAAMEAANTLVETQPFLKSAVMPMGLVVRGRIKLLKRTSRKDLAEALHDFDLALAYLKDAPDPTQTVPAAHYYTGLARYLGGDCAEAERTFRMVATDYAASDWSARARLSAGGCLAASGRPFEAMEELQQVRNLYAEGTPEAETARAWNTILHRLYVLPGAGQAPFRYSADVAPRLPQLSGVFGIILDPAREEIAAATNRGVQVFGADGSFKRQFPSTEVTGLFRGLNGRPAAGLKGAIQTDGDETSTDLTATRPNGTKRPLEEIRCGAVLLNGDVIVPDKAEKRLVKLAAGASMVTDFAKINASRLAVDRVENIAVLDEDDGRVVILDREGKNAKTVPPMIAGRYEIDRISDIAYDPLGNLYVLDRGSSSLHVFDPRLVWILTFSVKEKQPGAFRRAEALTLDSAGRLFIYDDRAQRILTFR